MLYIDGEMTGPERVRNTLHSLHLERSSWRMQAELDPSALRGLVEDVAVELGVSPAVARRVVESELGIAPLQPAVKSHRATRQEFPLIKTNS